MKYFYVVIQFLILRIEKTTLVTVKTWVVPVIHCNVTIKTLFVRKFEVTVVTVKVEAVPM